MQRHPKIQNGVEQHGCTLFGWFPALRFLHFIIISNHGTLPELCDTCHDHTARLLFSSTLESACWAKAHVLDFAAAEWWCSPSNFTRSQYVDITTTTAQNVEMKIKVEPQTMTSYDTSFPIVSTKWMPFLWFGAFTAG